MGYDDLQVWGGLADMQRGGPVAEAKRAQVRRLIIEKAEGDADRTMLLSMIGLATADEEPGPPDERCEGPCGRQMYRRNWPAAWKEGRANYGAYGKCHTCRKNEREGKGTAASKPAKKRGRPRKRTGHAYRRKTG